MCSQANNQTVIKKKTKKKKKQLLGLTHKNIVCYADAVDNDFLFLCLFSFLIFYYRFTVKSALVSLTIILFCFSLVFFNKKNDIPTKLSFNRSHIPHAHARTHICIARYFFVTDIHSVDYHEWKIIIVIGAAEIFVIYMQCERANHLKMYTEEGEVVAVVAVVRWWCRNKDSIIKCVYANDWTRLQYCMYVISIHLSIFTLCQQWVKMRNMNSGWTVTTTHLTIYCMNSILCERSFKWYALYTFNSARTHQWCVCGLEKLH